MPFVYLLRTFRCLFWSTLFHNLLLSYPLKKVDDKLLFLSYFIFGCCFLIYILLFTDQKKKIFGCCD